MLRLNVRSLSVAIAALASAGLFGACQTQTGTGNVNLANSNANISNTLANAGNLNAVNSNISSSAIDTREPDEYQATVKLTMEAVGDAQKTSLPALSANVARSGSDRSMEFVLPNGEKVIYLDKAGTNYLILPNRKQYAELDRESLGFEVRRIMMPEQIVNQVKGLQGVQRVGEETVGGRQVVKYAYAGTANTQTQAGQVGTEAYVLVDKETGLPLRSEAVTQSQSGGNVQGYKGFRMITEMTNIRADADPNLFVLPADFAKIDSEQVKSQVNLVFNAAAALIGQAMQQQPGTSASPAATVSPSPAR